MKQTKLHRLVLSLVILAFGFSPAGGLNAGGLFMRHQRIEGTVKAPDFPADLEWLNTDRKYSIKDFNGKLVLLDFWTYCCINCMHVIPDLKKLEAKYPTELVVIGVHSGKFTTEKGTDAIRQALLRYEIKHPVVNDKNFDIWREYGVSAWPTLVLIDPLGRIIGSHPGEGAFNAFDNSIQEATRFYEAKGELKKGPMPLKLEEEKETPALLSFPGKISADPIKHRLFISDSNHNRVLITDASGALIDVIGSGAEGTFDGTFEAAAFHLIRAAHLKKRTVETVLGTGRQAMSFNRDGKGTGVALNSPWDLAIEGNRLFIAMAGSHQIWVADLNTYYTTPYAGTGQEARVDGPLRRAALAQPSGLSIEGNTLYVADSEVSSVRSLDLDPRGDVRTLIGEDLFDYGDVDGHSETARLQHPLGVAAKNGLIYVADTYNSKIKVVDPEKRTSVTLVGLGEAGLANGPFERVRFNEPGGLAFLGEKLYVADTNNHEIRVVDLKTKTVDNLVLSRLEKLKPSKKAVFFSLGH